MTNVDLFICNSIEYAFLEVDPPSNLVATQILPNMVTLAWEKPVAPIDGYSLTYQLGEYKNIQMLRKFTKFWYHFMSCILKIFSNS